MDAPIVSVHFPKASGSSIKAAFRVAFGPENVWVENTYDPVDPANPLYIDPDRYFRYRPTGISPFRIVHGHFPAWHFDTVPDAIRITLLREPVDNIISIYYFWLDEIARNATGHALFEYVKREGLSLLEVAQLPLLRRLMSETYFGNYDMRKFSVVGSYEHRRDYFARISDCLGVNISADERANVTPLSEERGNAMADTRLMEQLRTLLQDDIRFYERHAGYSTSA